MLEGSYRRGRRGRRRESARGIVVTGREINPRRCDHRDAGFGELPERHLLHQEIAGQPIRPLDDYQGHAVTLDAIQEGREAGTIRELRRPTHAQVGKLGLIQFRRRFS